MLRNFYDSKFRNNGRKNIDKYQCQYFHLRKIIFIFRRRRLLHTISGKTVGWRIATDEPPGGEETVADEVPTPGGEETVADVPVPGEEQTDVPSTSPFNRGVYSY